MEDVLDGNAAIDNDNVKSVWHEIGQRSMSSEGSVDLDNCMIH